MFIENRLIAYSLLALAAAMAVSFLTQPHLLAVLMCVTALSYVVTALRYMYMILFLYGLLTIIVEWPNIPAKPLKKVMYLPLFPIFMLTYMPIALAALFMRVEWKPIRHTSVEKVKA